MKRTNLFIAIAILLSFGGGFFVAKLTSSIPPPIPPVPPIPITQNDTFQNCYDCDTTPHCKIPLYNVIAMVKNYKEDRFNIINNQPGRAGNFQDGRAILFDLESLKKYICRMERLAKTNFGAENYKLAGLRFVYTVYPEVSPTETQYMDEINDDYKTKHSLIIVPAYFNGTEYIDYDPLHYHVNSGTNVPDNFNAINTKAEVSIYDPLHPCNNGTNTMNHGSMCPPTCPAAPGSFLSVMDAQ